MTWFSERLGVVRKFTLPPNLGEWVVSYRFWLGMLVFRLPFMDQRFLANHDNYLTEKLPILLASYAASGIPIFIASVTVLKHRFTKPVNPVIAITVWIVSDIVLSRIAVLLLGKSELRNSRVELPLPTLIHAFGQVPIGAAIMFAVCLFFLGRSKTRDLRASVEKQSQLLADADAYRASIRETYARQVTGSILPGFERIKAEVAAITGSRLARGKLKDFAERVRDFSLSDVRNLGHQIAESQVAPLGFVEGSVDEIVENTRLSPLVLKPANPFLTAIVFFAFALIVNPESSFWAIFLVTLVVWCAFDVCARLHQIFVASTFGARLAILALSLILPVTLAFATNSALDPGAKSTSIAAFTASIVVITSIISYPYRFYAEVGSKLTLVNEQISSLLLSVRGEADEIRDSFSRFVHGKMQGRLALVSFILGQIANGELKGREKTKQVNRLIEIVDTIEADLKELTKQPDAKSLAEVLEVLATEWAGLVDLQLDIGQTARAWLELNQGIENQIAALIEEAVLNARVHGLASEVVVSVSVSLANPSLLAVEVEDNGRGLDLMREPGLGSRQFSAVCESWNIARVDSNHTKFSALVAGTSAPKNEDEVLSPGGSP